MVKVIVDYAPDPADLRAVHLATSRREPTERDWRPALRDTVGGRRVVWARFDSAPVGGTQIWVRHGDVIHRAPMLDVS